MANFDLGASDFGKYIESMQFVVWFMNGTAYGNVLPTTDLEYLFSSIIMVIGVCIYVHFFAVLIASIKEANAVLVDNIEKHEQAKRFCAQFNIEDDILEKIREFYNELSIKYDHLYETFDNLKELPTALATELSIFLFVNEIYTKVKFFQRSDPMFILSIARVMMPKLCMADNNVVEAGDIADEMFIIKNGIVEVLATDNSTVIAYLSEGCYFGEIGWLLTGTRSVTVKAKTVWIFFVIQKEDFVRIIERYPEQKAFLEAVGRQRMQTTQPEDLIDDEQEPMNIMENHSLLQGIQEREGVFENEDKFKSDRSSQRERYNMKNIKRLPLNVTKQYPILNQFIIIPFSALYYIWLAIMMIAVAYTAFIVPFWIAFEYSFETWIIPIDIFTLVIFAIDILLTSRTAFDKDFDIVIDSSVTISDYVNTRLFFDAISIIPLDYVLMISGSGQQTVAFIRLLRLIKLYKPFDYSRAYRKHSNSKVAPLTFFTFVVIFFLFAHLFWCITFYVGRLEVDHQTRWDGNTMFKDMLDFPFLDLKPVMEMSLFEQYAHFFYFGSCTIGVYIYGDIIPSNNKWGDTEYITYPYFKILYCKTRFRDCFVFIFNSLCLFESCCDQPNYYKIFRNS
jgi:CRP-like cAMP-binding protein